MRRAAADVRSWEARRRGRVVRLWIAALEVCTAACDGQDARFRLTRYIRNPYHRIGDVPVLRSTAAARPCVVAEWPDPVLRYPREAVSRAYDRTPHGALERAHVACYVRALATARNRVLNPSPAATVPEATAIEVGTTAPMPAPRPDGELTWWSVRHRVLFLAGPGEAPARAAELAATIVDDTGRPGARVARLWADDGFPDAQGRWVHPAAVVSPQACTALWDDYDAAEQDPGEPSALARVLGVAAVWVWRRFTADADDRFDEWNGRV